ncbi:hypothetical protein CFP71_10070 [Amycolatopsis thailandensis]|uniref:Uncharacterized protein n=1 Tax=Amycolatopsis thailandensis TaxID=589330 RepID=A0A229SDS6_9PSEU|nr:hypothetical protein [Amycolatopsis thailandensis]OXM57072.1 hypothetical protein CFP71_10070 [Amycolatopsis thailandensis]
MKRDDLIKTALNRHRIMRRPQAGEVLVRFPGPADGPIFPAIVDETWNSAAVPQFRYEIAKLVAAHINSAGTKATARAEWDGDTLVVTETEKAGDPGYVPERIRPATNGRYCILGKAWAWELIEQ